MPPGPGKEEIPLGHEALGHVAESPVASFSSTSCLDPPDSHYFQFWDCVTDKSSDDRGWVGESFTCQ